MLTNKTRLYAQHRLAGLNQTEAAIAAGYSAATATPAASRLEKNKNYLAHMARLRAKLPSTEGGEPVAKVIQTKKVKPAPKPEKPKPLPAALPPMSVERKPMHPSLKSDMSIDDLPAPLAYMFDVMTNMDEDPKLRLDAAKALASFTVAKPGELGKKEQKNGEAQKAASGKFASAAPPRLVARNG